MLTGYDLQIVGLYAQWGGEVCRACAIKKFSEVAVQLVEHGLRQHLGDWYPYMQWQADEDADFKGSECVEEYPEFDPEHPRDDRGCCTSCAVVFCEDCGARLSGVREE